MRPTTATGVFLGFAVLAAAQCWPLPRDLASRVANDPIDPLLNAWLLWHGAHVPPWLPAWWSPPAFAPMTGALALSEHLLGLLWMAAPAQWLGASPVAVVNALVMLSVPLAGFTMTWLVRHLTGRLDAALVAGCLFAFAPYRLAHLAHVQTLLVGWAPLVLLGLHRYVEDARWRWAVLSAIAYAVLALTSGYHLVYFSVVLAGWAAWFLVGATVRTWRPLLVAWTVAAVVVAVPLVGYHRVHTEQSLTRKPLEIEAFSASIDDLGRAPALSRLWGREGDTRLPEAALFPGGALIAALVAAGVAFAPRRRPAADGTPDDTVAAGAAQGRARSRPLWRHTDAVCLVSRVARGIALVALFLALLAAWMPIDVHVAGQHVSLSSPSKSGGIAAAAALIALVTSGPVVAARRRRAIVPFYVLAAAGTLILAFGPTIRFGDLRLWAYAPYRWLMALPGGDALRVPARMWLWTVCLLSVVAGLGLARLAMTSPRRTRLLSAALVVLAIADGWPRVFPMAALPAPPHDVIVRMAAEGRRVLELPMHHAERDTAAMYRGMFHRAPVVNGYSGHVPPHYVLLERAASERDPDVLAGLARPGGLLVRIDPTSPEASALTEWVTRAGGRPVASDEQRSIYLVEPPPGDAETSRAVPAHASRIERLRPGPSPVSALTDDDPVSRWNTDGPQQSGDGVTVELAETAGITGVTFTLGPFVTDYPRLLIVEVDASASPATPAWREVWTGPTAGRALTAVVTAPSNPRITLRWPAVEGNRIRLTTAGHPTAWWSMTSLDVLKAP